MWLTKFSSMQFLLKNNEYELLKTIDFDCVMIEDCYKVLDGIKTIYDDNIHKWLKGYLSHEIKANSYVILNIINKFYDKSTQNKFSFLKKFGNFAEYVKNHEVEILEKLKETHVKRNGESEFYDKKVVPKYQNFADKNIFVSDQTLSKYDFEMRRCILLAFYKKELVTFRNETMYHKGNNSSYLTVKTIFLFNPKYRNFIDQTIDLVRDILSDLGSVSHYISKPEVDKGVKALHDFCESEEVNLKKLKKLLNLKIAPE
jgi:hypothetical protein